MITIQQIDYYLIINCSSFTCINLHLFMLMIFHIVIKWYLIVICTYYYRVLTPKKMAVCSDCGKSRSFNFINMDNHANYLPINIWLKNHWLSKFLLPLMKHNFPLRVNFSTCGFFVSGFLCPKIFHVSHSVILQLLNTIIARALIFHISRAILLKLDPLPRI